jgi:hypothetical protein
VPPSLVMSTRNSSATSHPAALARLTSRTGPNRACCCSTRC